MKQRTAPQLNHRLNRRWLTYAAAAGAALTTAPAAVADIITTYLDTPFVLSAPGCSFMCWAPLAFADLNHDGANDFALWGTGLYSLDGARVGLQFRGGRRAEVMSSAAALPKGSRIGPQGKFRGKARMVEAVGLFYQPLANLIAGPWRGTVTTGGICSRHSCNLYGNEPDAYLGLLFYINGQAHYGWAELGLSTFAGRGEAGLNGELTAFAYETVAN
jgi:hypothetical protein